MDPVTTGVVVGGGAYPDSVESSPRSRGGESWDEPPFSSSSSSMKLRLMCSYGGRIVPRPTDKSLCYLGGETRIVVVERSSSLADLSAKLSRNLLGGRPFSLKYQLPNEDLDSLISVTTDEDLENMIEEYDRIAANPAASNAGPTKRVRLFLFPLKSGSATSSIGSLLDDSKSETWFVDALNGAMGMGIDGLPMRLSTDSASVNCLLGLEDDSSVHSRTGAGVGNGGGSQADPDQRVILTRPESTGKLTRQDVHSVPDSPMLDTTSSFGSTSSAPCLSNLPPIRVRPEDRPQPQDPRYANIDEHFAHMNLASAPAPAPAPAPAAAVQEIPKATAPPPPTIPLPNVSAPNPNISPTENPRPGFFVSEEERPDPRKPPLSSPPNQKPAPVEASLPERTVYYQERIPTAVAAGNPIPDPKRDIPVSDPAYRMQQVPESGYVMPQQQQHQQFIHTNPQFVQLPPYYQVPHPMQPPQPFDQQMPMYYLPMRQTPQPPPGAPVPMSKLPQKTDMQQNIYRTGAPPGAMVHMAADQGQMYNPMGYHLMHQHPSQAPPMANYGYEYANAVAAGPDSAQPQVYYTQATSPPSMPAQYQTVVPDDTKQNRGS